jgi:ATP-dependent RNA helicase RhlE
MNDFASFGLSAELLRGIQDLGFVEPTPIQIQAIPPAMAGRDVLACAMTGSGKTAAFLLPILQRFGGKPSGATRALVLTPTRELAAQIAEHLAGFAAHTELTGAAIFGGVASGPQEDAFRRGVDVLVATPGRLSGGSLLRSEAAPPGPVANAFFRLSLLNDAARAPAELGICGYWMEIL